MIHSNIILVTLEVFHFDMSGKDIQKLQNKNIPLISITLDVFFFEKPDDTFYFQYSSKI